MRTLETLHISDRIEPRRKTTIDDLGKAVLSGVVNSTSSSRVLLVPIHQQVHLAIALVSSKRDAFLESNES
eukprot:3538123-Amphidinium_carterae.1